MRTGSGTSPVKGPVDLLRSERPKGGSDFGPTHEGRAQIRHFGVTRPRICASMSVVLVPCTDEFSLRRRHSLNPHHDLEEGRGKEKSARGSRALSQSEGECGLVCLAFSPFLPPYTALASRTLKFSSPACPQCRRRICQGRVRSKTGFTLGSPLRVFTGLGFIASGHSFYPRLHW